MRPRTLLPVAASVALAAGLGGGACGTTSAPDPFGGEGGMFFADAGLGGSTGTGGASTGGAGGAPADAGPDADTTLGGPCTEDKQCDDGIACTLDRCDAKLGRCRFSPDDASCQDGLYCNGVERCDPKAGCQLGEPVGCSDSDPCTIDACVEATRSCSHGKRDVDQDGDPDDHCGGGDCNDQDPTVSSLVPEVCANGKDDNCNGKVDETPCTSPAHDTCLDPLEIKQPGSYAMDTTAAKLDYPTACKVQQSPPSARDVVAAVELPAGPPVDVEVTARTSSTDVAVAIASQCGDPASVLACGGPFGAPMGGWLAKVRARGLGDPAKATAWPVYVTTSMGAPVTVDVLYLPATPAPTNETCGTAATLQPGVPVLADLVGATKDLASGCQQATGELVYRFDLAAKQNVTLYATSTDGDGMPAISLRGPGCALQSDEIACAMGAWQQGAHLFWQDLGPGAYYVSVSASAPTTASLTLELSAPTPPPPNENCSGSPVLAPNHTLDVTMAGHQDDVNMGCLPGAVDVAYELDLPAKSDVLLVERIASGDVGAIELALPACAGPADLLACGAGAPSPVRTAKHGVPAGTYRVVAENTQGQPIEVTAFARDAVATTLVPFADACADALDIPTEGGLFQGNTANAKADFNAGCDQGGLPKGGAPDQLLRLTLAKKQRAIFDMGGSAYTTLLDVRKGPACPGTEIVNGCAVGYPPGRSFVDLTLDAGVYYVQIDGFNGDEGPWFLDVHVVDP
jgi:hypothetical protein